jgi:hypothetical protein
MAAEVLQEFLVNVKYVVDGASQESFLSGLKRVAARVGLLNAELAAIGTGLVVLAKKFAETGNELYQASQRMGMATDEIQSVSNAFWMLGMSTEQARGAMEGFAGFLRSYGPAGIGFLRAFGVSATDNVGRLKELGVELRKLGGADPNSPTYWMAQRLAARVGITDPLAVHYLATGEWAAQQERAAKLVKEVWGNRDPKEFAVAAEAATRTFRDLGVVLNNIWQRFGTNFLKEIQPSLDHILVTLREHLPLINSLLDGLAKAAGFVFRVVDLLITAFAGMFDLIDQIPGKLKFLEIAFAAVGVAMLATPFGRVIAMLSLLLGLLDDYMVWKAGGKSLFDYGGLEKTSKAIDQWAGTKDILADVLKTLTAIAALSMIGLGPSRLARGLWTMGRGLLRMLGLVAPAAAGAGAGMGATFTRGAGGLAGRLGARAGLAAIPVVGEIALGLWAAYDAWQAAKAAGWDPAKHGPGKWGEDAGKWIRDLFTDPKTKDAVTEGAEGFWDVVKDTWKTLTESQSDFDPTTGSAHGPQSWWGRVTQSVGGTGASGVAANAGDLGRKLMETLGISRSVAAAFLSNFQAESGLRADITYGGGGYNPQSGRAYGLAQWAGSRLADLRKFAEERHLDIRQESTQLAFLKHELGGKYAGVMAHLRAAEARGATPEQLADIVFQEFEAGHAAELQKYRGGHIAGVGAALNAIPTEHPATTSHVSNKGDTTINHSVTVNVPPQANPQATAHAVATEQTRAHALLVRDVGRANLR